MEGFALELNEVVGLLHILECKLCGVASPIRFGAQVGDLNHGTPQEKRHALRDLLGCDSVDVRVSLVAPKRLRAATKKG
jgi:hypothetical protein